jgi:probable HAF family extracellular repeat protein
VVGNTFLAFLYQHETGVTTQLDVPPASAGVPPFALANGISDNGLIAGETSSEPGHTAAVLWLISGGFELLPEPPMAFLTAANAVNKRGSVAGILEESFTGALVWRGSAHSVTRLPSLSCQGCTGSDDHANAINDRGHIVGSSKYSIVSNGLVVASGSHAVEWKDGNITDLGALHGSNSSRANGVSDADDIVGESAIASDSGAPTHAFLYRRGRMMDLGTLEGDISSSAAAIDDRGEIVGSSGTRAFIHMKGHMLHLDSLLDSTSPLADFVTLQAATAISANGAWIAADGTDTRDPTRAHAYLLMRLR